MKCPLCNGDVWTVRVIAFIGNAKLLYHYGKLLGSNPRYQTPDTWGCDKCETAGLIPRE